MKMLRRYLYRARHTGPGRSPLRSYLAAHVAGDYHLDHGLNLIWEQP